MEGHELARACAKALSEKKAQDIVILDVHEQTVVCSYFVIASGRSTTQVRALGDAVEEKIEKEAGLSPVRTMTIGQLMPLPWVTFGKEE